jgi:hypothetical protein
MSKHPRFQGGEEEPPRPTVSSRRNLVTLAILVLIVIVFVVLHLTGVVGPRLHGG